MQYVSNGNIQINNLLYLLARRLTFDVKKRERSEAHNSITKTLYFHEKTKYFTLNPILSS